MATAAEGDEGGVHGAHGPPEPHSSPSEQDAGQDAGIGGGAGSPRCLQVFLLSREEEKEEEAEEKDEEDKIVATVPGSWSWKGSLTCQRFSCPDADRGFDSIGKVPQERIQQRSC